MSIKKSTAGWLVDLQPGGRGGKRFRKTLQTKGEALAFEAWLKEKVRVSPEWAPAQKDRRLLSDLVEAWFAHHGTNLRSGMDTKARLLALAAAVKNPKIAEFSAEQFAGYRAERLKAGVKVETLNREQSYLRAMFNELSRLGLFSGVNPLGQVRQFRTSEREMSFLSLEQIKTLLPVLSGDALMITKVCLATGARWSEAESLRPSQVRGGAVHFSKTKSGKNRSVPVSESLEGALFDYLREKYGEHAGMADRFFSVSMWPFRLGIKKAGIVLPAGQLTHVLRHTFASHFMMNGGNILVLQKILGHSSLAMTMRYAHLAPEHLQEAAKLNPLAALTVS